jgi:MurNAc alpha-1-phosphate uridylyltransferase
MDGAKVEKFSIVPRLKNAISLNRVAGILHQGKWDDVGTPERLEAIQKQYGS